MSKRHKQNQLMKVILIIVVTCALIGSIFLIIFGRQNFTQTSNKGTLNITLSWPLPDPPKFKICAVHVNNKRVVCKGFITKQKSYSIELNAGEYNLYVDSGSPVYYTNCDKYPNLKCIDQNWYYLDGFICYKDPKCKFGFTPATVAVNNGGSIDGINISRGGPLPCPYNEFINGGCTPSWDPYLK